MKEINAKTSEHSKGIKKLNIGCGRDVRKGWVNLDMHNKLGADVVWDLNKLPLPFDDDSFDYIYCGFVLEDFENPIPLMEELIRISKPKGKVEVQVAHETTCWDNLYHQRGFTLKALKDFVERADYGTERNVRIVKSGFCHHTQGGELKLNQKIFISYQKMLAFFCNLFPTNVIEFTFLKYLFAGVAIKIVYQKIK